MTDEEKPEWQPEREENIFLDETGSKKVDRSNLSQLHLSDTSSTDDEDEQDLRRIQTSRSIARQQTFEPIASGDREALHRIASNFGSPTTRTSTKASGTRGSELQRRDTLYGVK